MLIETSLLYVVLAVSSAGSGEGEGVVETPTARTDGALASAGTA